LAVKAVTCDGASAAGRTPLLESPVKGFRVRAVLDQDASLTSGLMVAPDGRRAVLLVGAERFRPGQQSEHASWTESLAGVAAVAPAAPVVGVGATPSGHPYLACVVEPSMADIMRLAGPPVPDRVRGIGAAAADVLAAAHSYGLTHGAICPATVMVGTETPERTRLGGFGVTAPGLAAPIGLWAFTPPEHRHSALDGETAASAGGDVFSLAATLCAALAGSVPWSPPVTWADEAELPRGQAAPAWVTAIREALCPDPDGRPNAEEFAAGLRQGGDLRLPAREPGARVDLRPLLPRAVRRLCAYSLAAMADEAPIAHGRAVAPRPMMPETPVHGTT
jgi:eukaryotic-like serine/threonine-protein kinase